jgi:hypothetical protein
MSLRNRNQRRVLQPLAPRQRRISLQINSMFTTIIINILALQKRMQFNLIHRRQMSRLGLQKFLQMVNSVITHPTTPNLARIDGILNCLPGLETFLGSRVGTVDEVQIDVPVPPFRERGIDGGLGSFVSVVRITQFSRKKDLLSAANQAERGRYILAFPAGLLHPGGHGTADIGFVAVPRGTVDVPVSSFEGGQY